MFCLSNLLNQSPKSSFLALFRSELARPNNKHSPAEFAKFRFAFRISYDISLDFLFPKPTITGWHAGAFTFGMAVPKATVYEDD
jgi:hypothetical protein